MSLKNAALWLLLAGCTGELVGPRDAVTPARVGSFSCDPAADPSAEVVLRLTPTQYRNALEDLLGRAFTATEVHSALTTPALTARFAAIPADGSTHRAELTYDSMDQRISPLLVEPQFDIATGLGEWIASDAARLARFTRTFGGCATPSTPECPDAVIEALGVRALRRPVDDDDRTTYRAMYADPTWGGYRALIAGFLMAPDFLFRTEFHGEALDGRSDLTRLTAYELASRAAFALTNAPPDDALLDAASRDFTGEGATLDEQVTRLLGTTRAQGQFEHFYKQWLRRDRVSGINPSALGALTLAYPDQSAPALAADTNLEQLRLDAFDELVELMGWYAQRGSLHDAVMSDVSFARTSSLAQVYGVTPWNGSADALIHFPAGQRAGLFTRAGYLLSGYPDTNPVMRGARLRVEYLCDVMEPPANTTPPAAYVAPAVPTVRAVVTAKTQIAGTACQGCHELSINPLGFPLERYDAFGRYRTQEPLLDGQGGVSAWVPIDSSTRPDLDRDGTTTVAADGVSLSALLADSPRLNACYARHTFRYVRGRREVLAAGEDGCMLAGMERASSTGSLQDVVRALTGSSDFTRRRMPAGN